MEQGLHNFQALLLGEGRLRSRRRQAGLLHLLLGGHLAKIFSAVESGSSSWNFAQIVVYSYCAGAWRAVMVDRRGVMRNLGADERVFVGGRDEMRTSGAAKTRHPASGYAISKLRREEGATRNTAEVNLKDGRSCGDKLRDGQRELGT